MSLTLESSADNKFYLAYNLEKNIFHYGELLEGSVCATGQPVLESFKTEMELRDRLCDLTGDSKYYDNLYDNNIEELSDLEDFPLKDI